MSSDMEWNESLIYAVAAECPGGFTPVLEHDCVWFIANDALEDLPPQAREKLRVVKPH